MSLTNRLQDAAASDASPIEPLLPEGYTIGAWINHHNTAKQITAVTSRFDHENQCERPVFSLLYVGANGKIQTQDRVTFTPRDIRLLDLEEAEAAQTIMNKAEENLLGILEEEDYENTFSFPHPWQ